MTLRMDLRSKLIRLAHAKPELRADLLPILATRPKRAVASDYAFPTDAYLDDTTKMLRQVRSMGKELRRLLGQMGFKGGVLPGEYHAAVRGLQELQGYFEQHSPGRRASHKRAGWDDDFLDNLATALSAIKARRPADAVEPLEDAIEHLDLHDLDDEVEDVTWVLDQAKAGKATRDMASILDQF